MRTYTWDEYYEKFYDWAESTQVRNLSALTSLGNADEVAEIIIELQVNVPAANRLLKKAVEAKLKFTGTDLVEFLCVCDKALPRKRFIILLKDCQQKIWKICMALSMMKSLSKFVI